jgi:hypothetical protein
MFYWEISARIARYLTKAEIKIPLNSFLNGFKIVKSEIVDDTLIIKLVTQDPKDSS